MTGSGRPLAGGTARSLRTRLLIGTLGGVLLLWLATLAAVWYGASHELEELLDGHLAQTAAMIAVLGGEDAASAQPAPRLHEEAKRVQWQVWRGETLLRRSAGAPLAPLAEQRRGYAQRNVEGRAWRVFSTGTLPDGRSVQIAERLSDRRDILGALGTNLLWPMLLSLPLLAVAVLLAVRISLAPLTRLRTALEARGALALEPLPSADAPAEVRPLVAAINALLGRIDLALAQEKRCTADAAHELRTPIAALRAQAQVAIASSDARERRAALDATLAACDRMARLLEQLLTLARLDARDAADGGRGLQARVDLDALVRASMARIADGAPSRGDDLELRSAGPTAARAESTLIEVLLRNLVDNALRYSAAGTPVLVRLESAAGAPRLTVEDGGPGLEPASVARLGERFFRAAPEGPSGTGLGWSIVRRVTELHGARIAVDRSPALGGLRVQVTFPSPPPGEGA